jgi:hypothetical protein
MWLLYSKVRTPHHADMDDIRGRTLAHDVKATQKLQPISAPAWLFARGWCIPSGAMTSFVANHRSSLLEVCHAIGDHTNPSWATIHLLPSFKEIRLNSAFRSKTCITFGASNTTSSPRHLGALVDSVSRYHSISSRPNESLPEASDGVGAVRISC